MTVTATEFKVNLGKYLDLVKEEDIYITRNGKTVAKMVNPHVSAVDSITGIFAGKLPDNYDKKELREERLGRYANDD